MLRAVLFDAVGTLIYPEPEVPAAYREAAAQFGSRLDPEEVARRFQIAFKRQEQRDAAEGTGRTDESRERRRWEAIVTDVFCDVADCGGLFAALWEHFRRPEHWRLYDDVAETLDRLARQGLLLGLASNFDSRLEAICEGHSALARLAARFVSSQLGFRKPHRGFFRAIERKLGLPPEELLLVGDDRLNDFEGSRAAGWQACLLVRDPRAPLQTRSAIRSLRELVVPTDG